MTTLDDDSAWMQFVRLQLGTPLTGGGLMRTTTCMLPERHAYARPAQPIIRIRRHRTCMRWRSSCATGSRFAASCARAAWTFFPSIVGVVENSVARFLDSIKT